MKKLLSIILLITMLLSMATAAFADGVDGPMQKAKIKVAISADFKPFEYYDENGELTGFDVDLMNYIGEKIDFDIEFVNMSFDKLIPAVVNEEVDCAISAITVTEERDSIIDYSREYLKTYNITFDENGKRSTKHGEQYAIVFREGLAGSPYEDLAEPTGDETLYILIDKALRELSNDRTVMKLIEKYELNKPLDESTVNVEYSAIMSGGDPGAKNEDSEPKTSATSIPASEWAWADIDKAKALNIINYGGNYNFPGAITREKFCELAYNYIIEFGKDLEVSNNHKFKDTDNEKIEALNSLEIIYGKSEIEFAPNDLLTREEAATILNRLINVVHPDLASTELYFEFADGEQISDWSMSAIQRICNMGIMKGVGNNNFAPQDNYTTEQAVVTLVRVYANSGESKFDNLTFADKLNANMPIDKNYMFSPLSIKMALMMAANGASGETLEEILKVTGVEDLENYNNSTRAMLDKYSESDILTLNVSNSIWINSDKTPQRFSKTYQDKLSKTFDATSNIVTDKNAVSEINGWVNDKTEGKIPTIITEDNKDFWAMLVNAVYFKGRWLNEFNKGATEKDVFTSRDSSQTEIDFMNRRAWMSYANTDGVSIVALPYLTRQDVFNENGEYIETKKLEGVNISMYLMMSDKEFNPEEVLYEPELKSKYIALSVPKFDVEYSVELNDILKTIGIKKAFEMDAEFSSMFNGGNMWLDSTIHKTYIKVDEEGTEATAVTAGGMGGSSLPPEPIEVKFNKPFTFVIKDNVNSEILFMGEYAFAE